MGFARQPEKEVKLTKSDTKKRTIDVKLKEEKKIAFVKLWNYNL